MYYIYSLFFLTFLFREERILSKDKELYLKNRVEFIKNVKTVNCVFLIILKEQSFSQIAD